MNDVNITRNVISYHAMQAEKKQQEEEQANRLAREADLEKQRLLADAQYDGLGLVQR